MGPSGSAHGLSRQFDQASSQNATNTPRVSTVSNFLIVSGGVRSYATVKLSVSAIRFDSCVVTENSPSTRTSPGSPSRGCA